MHTFKKSITLALVVLLFYPGYSFAQDNPDEHMLMINAVDWSPDGESLLFTAIILKKDFSDFTLDKWGLWQMELEDRSITKLETGVLFASYAPAGDRIAYGKQADENWDIYVRTLFDGQVKRLTTHPSTDNSPDWSPDGSKIVFNSERSGGKEIFVIDADENNLRQITDSKPDTVHSFNPQWSQDGNRIVYFLEKGDHKDQIYLTDSDGSFFRNLTRDNKHNFYPAWGSDSTILYTAGSEENRIYVMNSDGTDRRPVQGLRGRFAKHSPANDTIAAIRKGSNEDREIILFNTHSGTAEKIVDKALLMKFQ